jgi:hypothetical protein
MAPSCAANPRPAEVENTATRQAGCLQGSYIQLLDQHARWLPAQWQTLFEHLSALQVQSVVLQWSALDQRPFYRAVPVAGAPDLPAEAIMRMADANGMRVMVGLSHDLTYWTRVGRADRRVYLRERLRLNQRVSAELKSMVVAHPSFAGWYISEEVDDLNWTDPADRQALFAYLGELSDALRKLTPQAQIGVSGFVNRRTDPRVLRDFWIELLAHAPAISQVYFQDGIGVDKLTLTELPRYYAAMREAVSAAGREMVPVVEAFRQVAGPPVSKAEFRAVPTTPQRLNEQIGIADQFSARHVVFGVPEYLTPAGGAQAARLYQHYSRNLLPGSFTCKFIKSKIANAQK